MGASGSRENDIGDDYRGTVETSVYVLSAVSSGVKDVREVIQKAEGQRFFNTPNPILFIDKSIDSPKPSRILCWQPLRKVP